MKLIVGLGNPGKGYEHTRHNIGEELLRAYAEHHQLGAWKTSAQHHASLVTGLIHGKKVLCAFPTTCMNDSGRAVQSLSAYYQIAINDILIIQDELDLSVSKAKFTAQGSSAGHNGIKSIQQSLQTQAIGRLRIGISKPGDKTPIEDFVLQRFTQEERQQLQSRAHQYFDAIDSWIQQDLTNASSLWNGVLGDTPTSR